MTREQQAMRMNVIACRTDWVLMEDRRAWKAAMICRPYSRLSRRGGKRARVKFKGGLTSAGEFHRGSGPGFGGSE